MRRVNCYLHRDVKYACSHKIPDTHRKTIGGRPVRKQEAGTNSQGDKSVKQQDRKQATAFVNLTEPIKLPLPAGEEHEFPRGGVNQLLRIAHLPLTPVTKAK